MFWIGLMIANALIILFYWLSGSLHTFGAGLSGTLVAFGRLAGLTAAYTVLLQFVFMGRMTWLEKVFGLDKLSVIHGTSGKLSLIFILLHPLLLVVGLSLASGAAWVTTFTELTQSTWQLMLALVALVLFIFVVVSSLYVVKKRLPYEAWYFVHLFAYLAVFSSFWHQLNGEDLLASRTFYIYWISLYVAVFTSHLVFRFIRPVYRFYKHKFRVTRIVRENHSVVSVYIGGDDMDSFTFNPGQFMKLRFFSKDLWWQSHPFSISMTQNGREVRITIKELGDFTRQVKNIPIGTQVLIDGPYGVFTDLFAVSNKVLLVAGGIGITPIRSVMEEMLKKGKDVVLLYANRTKEDIVFKQELDELAREHNARITHVLSHDDNRDWEKGYIDEEKVARLVPDVSTREVYVCGPKPMMDSIIKIAQDLGVEKRKIHYEKFSLA